MLATSRADRSLPAGTVTFLLTDIADSTRLWETQQENMQVALARHDAIMREAIESHGGHLVKSTGDGVLAAFTIASDAMAACLAAQRALKQQPPGELTLACRMALHSGVAELRDGDYYGPAVNRAARLMAAAHGGQILLSLATEELVRDHLPADIALRDMGERRLKDLIRPERVFQSVAPDLPADFPPLKTLDERPNNLPGQTTPFIGREQVIRAIKKRLSDVKVRLLTLTGVGGTGKTRLALQAAADLVDEFEHGVFFVPLAALSDPALVAPTIAQAFAVRESAGKPLQEQLKDFLRQKQLLLVLDNFEQVIEAAPLVTDLLAAASRLKILVTSREVLRVSGETDYPVPPLDLPDPKRLPPLDRLTQYEAMTLFIDRAVAVKPTFAVTNENAPAVAEICHRLDGLPLAIELAAARVRALTPQRMLTELSNRLNFLKGGARDLPARQQALRSAIDWSHDLLADHERRLFRRLAVFAGGCTLESMEAVCNPESDVPVLETAESLVAKSLLKQTEILGEPRFAMLETIREYAGDRLHAAGDEQRVRERHCDYFLHLAEDAEPKLAGAEQAEWLQRLEEEHDNLRAGLEWSIAGAEPGRAFRSCAALQKFWLTRGHLSEGRQWCARALAKTGDEARTLDRARTLNAAGILAYYQADYSVSRARQEAALAIQRHLGDRKGIATSLNNLGNLAWERADLDSARSLYEEALSIRRELRDRSGMAPSLNNLGNLACVQGDFGSARALYEESLAIRRELGDRGGVANSLHNLGNLAANARGDYPAARAMFEESIAIKRELGNREGLADSLKNLGDVAREQCRYPEAERHYEESLTIRRELGGRGIAYSLEGRASVLAVLGSALVAARVWGAAERLREETGSPLPPVERPHYERQVASGRAALNDDAAFNAGWQEGRALTLEQAIELALEKRVERP